jgi:serine/threonine protein kinase
MSRPSALPASDAASTPSNAISPPIEGAAAPAAAAEPATGTGANGRMTIGRYRILRELGKGATSVVYQAEDPQEGRHVALKVILFGDEQTKQSRRLKRLFRGEASMAQELNHPNIVKIYDSAIEDEMAYIAMEFVAGVPLTRYTTFDKLLPPHRVTAIIFKAAMALDYAARRGIVHRDIKPDNILLTPEDDVKITDFGLALDIRKKDAGDTTFIMGVGSPAYMSPEQIKDYPLNPQTDLYSLGVVMFEMLTGRRPYRGKNYAQLVYKIVNMDAPSVSSLNPSVPNMLDPVVKRALEKDLYSRYRTGAQMAQDISGAKFQILEDDEIEKFNLRFRILRQISTFVEFDNEELWEVLRISTWRRVHEGYAILNEGDEGASFGVIVEGTAEVSQGGKLLAVLEPGDVLGEMAFMARKDKKRCASVVATADIIYLEVNPSAYELSSEECKEKFEEVLIHTLNSRLNAANARLAELAPEARRGKDDDQLFELMPME